MSTISDVSDVLTAAAALSAALIARSGLQTWRAEKIGSRKMDVAEDICSDIDKFIKIMTISTHMFSHNSEIELIVSERYGGVENPYLKSSASYYKPIVRISKEREFIERFYEKSHIAFIYFGHEGENLILECISIQKLIYIASDYLEQACMSGRLQQATAEEPEYEYIVNMGSSPGSALHIKCVELRSKSRNFFTSVLQNDQERKKSQPFNFWEFLWG